LRSEPDAEKVILPPLPALRALMVVALPNYSFHNLSRDMKIRLERKSVDSVERGSIARPNLNLL
jgi:hypothetical protein